MEDSFRSDTAESCWNVHTTGPLAVWYSDDQTIVVDSTESSPRFSSLKKKRGQEEKVEEEKGSFHACSARTLHLRCPKRAGSV